MIKQKIGGALAVTTILAMTLTGCVGCDLPIETAYGVINAPIESHVVDQSDNTIAIEENTTNDANQM